MAKDDSDGFYPVPVIDQSGGPGPLTRLMIFVVILTVSSILFAAFKDSMGDPFLLGMLGILAMVGIGFLFATAIGLVRIAPRSAGDELSKAYLDTLGQGVVVTDQKGRVIYANRAYARMTGAEGAPGVKTLDSILSDNPEASPVLFRLTSALRDGQSGDGEFRLSQAIRPGSEPGACWYRVRARAFKAPTQRQPVFA